MFGILRGQIIIVKECCIGFNDILSAAGDPSWMRTIGDVHLPIEISFPLNVLFYNLGDQHNKQKKNESNPSPSDVDPSTAFISADLILTRIYWSESLEILFFHIYLPVETNKYVNGNGQPTKPGKTGQIQASVNERVAADMDLLSNLTDEQLVLLFWKLHFLIQAGKITEDGTVIIDGKEYNIADLITSCCPMG